MNKLDGKKEFDELVDNVYDIMDEIYNELPQQKAGFNPSQPRDKDGQWSKTGWHSVDLDEQLSAHNTDGGSTFTMDGKNQVGAKGMGSVSTFTSPPQSVQIKGNLTKEILEDFIDANRGLLEDSDKYGIGTWYDNDTGILWLDIVTVTELQNAIKLGIEHNQISIFDLENLIEIKTGGTGNG